MYNDIIEREDIELDIHTYHGVPLSRLALVSRTGKIPNSYTIVLALLNSIQSNTNREHGHRILLFCAHLEPIFVLSCSNSNRA